MSSIFISHSSNDNEAAVKFKDWLEAKGHTSLFLDFDPDAGIQAGSDWEQVLYRALRQCQAVIVLLTPSWLTSKWCFAEVVQAREKGKAIFVAKVKPCDASGVLTDLQHVDLTTGETEGFEWLAKGLKVRGLDPKNVFAWDSQRPPYPGLHNFGEKDAAIFFGRDAEIYESLEVLNSLQRKGANASRFVLFLGASGSGKSSLVQAGLLPRLRKDSDNWLPLRPFRPQKDPLEELAVVLAMAFKDLGKPRDWQTLRNVLKVAAEQETPDAGALITLACDLQLAANHPEATVLMVIDQAEELVGYSASDKAYQFLRLLRANLADADRRLIVLATMRSDFLGEFQTHPALAGFDFESFTVPPMLQDNIPQVIERPASLSGVRLEKGLVATILQDVTTRDALPLLAFTLRRLYEQGGDDGVLAIQEYRALGGLEASVRQAADQVIKEAKLNAVDLEVLHSAFIPHMVRISEDGQYARRLVYQDQLPRRSEPLLKRFVNARLLVSDRDKEGRETLEIAHEALLRTWPMLMDWLEEDKYKLRLADNIRRSAQEWDEGGRTTDLLTHREGRLNEAQSLVQERRFSLTEHSIDRLYLDCCGQLQRQQVQAKRRRIKWTIGGLTTGLIIVLGFASVAFFQWRVSEVRRINAEVLSTSFEIDDLFNSHLQIEALLKGLKRGRELQKLRSSVDPTRLLLFKDVLRGVLDSIYEKNRLEGHNDTINSVSYSPDGKILVSAGKDKKIYLWNTEGHLLGTLEGHDSAINSVSFSPDGKVLASASDDNTVKLWNVEEQLLTGTLIDSIDRFTSVSFSPDGKTIATVSSEYTLQLWSTDGQLVSTLERQNEPGSIQLNQFSGVSFNPDGNILAAPSWDNTVKLWSTKGQLLGILEGHNVLVSSVSFSPDGKTIATASGDSTVKLWNSEGQLLHTLNDHVGSVKAVVFSPDGKTLASTGWDKTVRLWNTEGQLLRILDGHKEQGISLSFSPDGKTLASASEDKTVRLWSTEEQIPRTLALNTYTNHLSFSPDSKTIASKHEVNRDDAIGIWSIEGKLIQILEGHHRWFTSAIFSPDGKTVASVDMTDSMIRLWSTEGRLLRTLNDHGSSVRMVSFSPDSKILASANDDKTIKLWSVEGQLLHTLEGHGGQVYSVAFSKDMILASASEDETVKLWNRHGQLLHTLKDHTAAVNSVDFSPNGKILASVDREGKVKLWNIKGKKILSLEGHTAAINSVSFSPDGKTLASASEDKTIKLWSTKGELLRTLEGYDSAVNSVSFSPDGNVLGSSSGGTIKLWNFNLEKLLLRGCYWLDNYLGSSSNISDGDKEICPINN